MRDDDERPRRVVSHELGQKLDDLSIADLDERIALLRAEIARLDLAKRAKQAAAEAAGSVFGRRAMPET